jgi:hypothetical protein
LARRGAANGFAKYERPRVPVADRYFIAFRVEPANQMK